MADSSRVLTLSPERPVPAAVADCLSRTDHEFDLESVATTTEGLDRLADDEFDCVLCDYDLPTLDAPAFLEAVHAETAALPVIFYSMGAPDDTAHEVVTDGADSFVSNVADANYGRLLAAQAHSAATSSRAVNRSETGQPRKRFKRAVEEMGRAVYITDTDGTIEYVNPAFEEITGYSAEDALGRTPRMLNSGEMSESYYEELWATVTDGDIWEAEIVDQRQSDESYPAYQTIAPIVEAGEVTGYVAIQDDITERKEREEQAEKRRAALRQIIDLVPDPIFAKNRDGEYLLANEAVADVYGLSPDDIQGAAEADIIPSAEDLEPFREDDLAVIESGETVTNPVETLTTADGETRIFQTTKIPYQHAQTAEPAVLGYARDITDLKHTEQELRRERDRLDEFASFVSHDLRNPLNVAMSRTELAIDDCESEHLDAIDRSLDRIEQLITDLLALAREGNTVGEVESVALDALASNSWRNVDTDHARLEMADPPTVLADSNRLRTLFENLFRNAVEHGSTSNQAEPGDAVEHDSTSRPLETDTPLIVTVGSLPGGDGFYVADDGSGIPPDERDRVFESGYSTNRQGTGFGLAIAEQIVAAHGWEITVTESADGGARFEVRGVDSVDG